MRNVLIRLKRNIFPLLTQTIFTSASMEYRRADGVVITHDPYAPGMAEKYGKPGQTDNEGFDPYADSVGPGIYGGIVKRDQHGNVVIGKQYQNHNKRPGPVYAGGGYAPISKALKSEHDLRQLLEKYPDLANDITTGGAQPLHMCGMSRTNQDKVSILVDFGADVEALETYGMTPLHRMASNNLDIGARMLLEAGADSENVGKIGESPRTIALQSDARKVLAVLDEFENKKIGKTVKFVSVHTAIEDLNGNYYPQPASKIPSSFALVCHENNWRPVDMWEKLNNNSIWYQHENNDSYIYFNNGDGKWWMDGPDGLGVFINQKASHNSPPSGNWQALDPKNNLNPPELRIFRE